MFGVVSGLVPIPFAPKPMFGSWFSRYRSRRPRLDVGAATDIGFVRQDNEDAYGVFNEGTSRPDWLLVVADGMGGLARGAEASSLAVDGMRRGYYAATGKPADRLRAAFREANRVVFERANGMGLRMGTTCAALSYIDAPIVAHVGDSRVYEIGADHATPLTVDHNLASELRDKGVITASEALQHPGGHALTRAIGVSQTVEPAVRVLPAIRVPRWYVLCTDGLRQVGIDRVAALVRRLETQQACEALVGEANQGGGSDNSTVVVARFR